MASRPAPGAAAERRASDLLAERTARHGVRERGPTSVLDAVRITTAIQAQDTPASYLGVRARSTGLTEQHLLDAVADRSIVRTWLMRGTIHLVVAEDLDWLVALIGPTIRRRYRTRWQQIGLSDELLDRSLELLPEVLADGPMERREITAALAERRVVIDSPDTQADTHLVVHATTTGLVCRGPDRGRASTFVLTDDWLAGSGVRRGPGPRGDDAVAELARRYFAAYSPATAADFGTWSGLPGARSVALIAGELEGVEVNGRPAFRPRGTEGGGAGAGLRRGPVVSLLPAFDNYLIGYADRSALIDAGRYGSVYQGGMIRPTVLVDGAVAGTWRLERRAGRLTVEAFRAFTAAQRRALDRELEDVARFLGTGLGVTVG